MLEGEERMMRENMGRWSVQGIKCGFSAISAVTVPVGEVATRSIREKVGSERSVNCDLHV